MQQFTVHTHDVMVRWAAGCPACPATDLTVEEAVARINTLQAAVDQLVLDALMGA